MKKIEITFPVSSMVPDSFKYVPFVSASEQVVTTSLREDQDATSNCLTGAEASQFYKDVVSTPSCLPSPPVLKCNKRTVGRGSKISSSNSRLSIFHHAQDGNIEGIKYCLAKDLCVDEQDMYGWTPLMCATFEGHYTAAEFLIKKGAKADIKNKQGLTALDIAFSKKNKALVEIFKTGIINEHRITSSKRQLRKVTRYCDTCKFSYDENIEQHERSIAHLFASKRNESSSTYYHIPESNKGFQIMLKKGWDKNNGLGANATGRKFPVKTVLKTDRMCIGNEKSKPKVTHFGPNDYRSVKNFNQQSLNLKREQKLKKKEAKQLEYKNRKLEIEYRRQFHAD